jgi:hypothetical protein
MKRMFWVCLLVFGFILNWSMVSAADVYVESSGSCGGKTPCYSTIQAAINAANSGDTIKLAQGIYAETFVLSSGKQLITQGGWDAEFKNQTPRTTSIRAPVVPNGAIAFQELRIMEIAGPMGNATIADVLDGRTFSSAAGTGLTGSMPNREGRSYTPTTTDQAIAAGYYNGSGKVEGDADLVSENIRNGVNIFGVTGRLVDASNATRVPKTGQTDCWNQSGNPIKCAGTRQDGEYQLGVLLEVTPLTGIDRGYTVYGWTGDRFTDNLDGTVTDNLTGLVWLKNAYCFGSRIWTDALGDSNTLATGSCGLADGSVEGRWRLPNINELHSLVDPTQANLALPTGFPFIGVQSGKYWSSTTYEPSPFNTWGVNMDTGFVFIDTKSHSYYVWPVRSED